MEVSYKKLKILMVEYNLLLKDLHSNAEVCSATMSKINKGEFINIQSLIRICRYLSEVSGKQIKIDDIIDYE